MIRRNKQAPLLPVTWQEAMDYFVERFRDAWRQGHQNLACYNSGQLTLEELYTLGKLWRGGLRSANIDGNTRLCTATSATGLMLTFGQPEPWLLARLEELDGTSIVPFAARELEGTVNYTVSSS